MYVPPIGMVHLGTSLLPHLVCPTHQKRHLQETTCQKSHPTTQQHGITPKKGNTATISQYFSY